MLFRMNFNEPAIHAAVIVLIFCFAVSDFSTGLRRFEALRTGMPLLGISIATTPMLQDDPSKCPGTLRSTMRSRFRRRSRSAFDAKRRVNKETGCRNRIYFYCLQSRLECPNSRLLSRTFYLAPQLHPCTKVLVFIC